MEQTFGFGMLLRRYRRTANLTQEALAERAGYSEVYIGMLERGQKEPVRATVELLADALVLAPRDRALLLAAAALHSDAGAAPPLVGRAREMDVLTRHLTGDGPPLLLLTGEPGIGKSRLLQEALRRAPGYGWSILYGGCRRGGQAPYAPILDALERHIRLGSPTQVRGDLHGCPWLVRLLPELAETDLEALPPWTLPPDQERRLMCAAVSRFLSNVAGTAGTLLVLDDLHWSGPDALDLLTAILHSSAPAPVRVIGAYSDAEVRPGDGLRATLGDLVRARMAAQDALDPLDAHASRRLLDSILGGGGDTSDPPDIADIAEISRARAGGERVVRRAGGVPDFIVNCATALRRGEPEDAVPWDLAQGLRQRVARLSTTAQDMLGVVAVADRAVSFTLLVAALDLPEREVLVALESACAARLLTEEQDGYRFTHEVMREAVDADLSAARRFVLRRRIAAAPDQDPGSLAPRSTAAPAARSRAGSASRKQDRRRQAQTV